MPFDPNAYFKPFNPPPPLQPAAALSPLPKFKADLNNLLPATSLNAPQTFEFREEEPDVLGDLLDDTYDSPDEDLREYEEPPLEPVEPVEGLPPVADSVPGAPELPPPIETPTSPEAPPIPEIPAESVAPLDSASATDIPVEQPISQFFPASVQSPAPTDIKGIALKELNSLYDTWAKNQTSEDLEKLLVGLSDDIDKAIYAYVGANAGPAVKSKAKLLAIKAIKSFDPKGASNLRSWVYTQLQPLTRYARETEPSPKGERANQQTSEMKRQEAEFYENHGRAPTDAELADIMGVPVEKIEQLREDDKRTTNEGQVIGEEGNTTAQELVSVEEQAKFNKDVLDTMYEFLTEEEQFIINHKLGYNGNPIYTNAQIAQKLGISPGRVSQITVELAKKLEEYAELIKEEGL